MQRMTMLLIVGVLIAGSAGGCKSASDTEAPPEATQVAEAAETGGADVVVICAKCGQVKGTDLCCKPDQKLCESCGLVKGSPGCCVLPKGGTEDVKLCTKCGFIKGSEECCKTEGKKICDSCGLIKGSPGCCKIKGI